MNAPIRTWALVVAIAWQLCGCASLVVPAITGEVRDWEFVQTTGGIAAANVEYAGNRRYLVVDYGTLQKPTAMNSALVVRAVRLKEVAPGALVIELVTEVSGRPGRSSAGRYKIDASRVPRGRYDVFYGSRDASRRVGSVEIR